MGGWAVAGEMPFTGKVFVIGTKHTSIVLEGYYHVMSPKIGPDWQFRLQLTFVLPK